MKAHINEEKTAEELQHEAEVRASANDYFNKMIERQNAKPPLDQIPVVHCTTNEEYETKLAMAEHSEEMIDETKFPAYDPNCGLSYEDWLFKMSQTASSNEALIQRYGVNKELITEIIKRPEDNLYDNDCPFDIDLTGDDTGMVSSVNLSPEDKKQISGDFVNKNYVERKAKEMNLGGNIQSGLFGSSPNMTQFQQPQIQMNPYYNNYQTYNQRGTFQFGNNCNPYINNYQNNSQFEIIDGIQVRKISPYFTVCPNGNPFQDMFKRISMYPNHPQYEEIKNKFTEEEFKYIKSMKVLGRLAKPSNISKEEFEKYLDSRYNPYSKEAGIPIQTQNTNNTVEVKPTVLKCRIKLINPITDEVIADFGKKESVEIHDQNWVNQELYKANMKKAERDAIQCERINRINAINKYHEAFLNKFPDLNTVSTEDFFNGKSDLGDRIYDYLVVQPEIRKRKWETINATYDTYNYLRNMGMTYNYRMNTHSTAGEDIIRKCNLKPGDPLYDYYKKETEHHNWMAQNCFNPDGTPKHDDDYNTKKMAYKLSLEYPSNNISPGSPCCNVPQYIQNTLPQEVLVELGYTTEPVKPQNPNGGI